MTKPLSTAKHKETAVLVALITPEQTAEQVQEYVQELAFLAETAGAITLKSYVQKLNKPDIATFIGKGKVEEVHEFVSTNEVDMVIFDDDLTPSQVRNLEQKLGCKILDRSLLILNIFSGRAQTAQAKTQVELAQYQYILPRLTKMWTHLSKQKGGIGMRGPGEKELETDRRIVRDKIALFSKKLDKIDKQSATRRKARQKVVRVALVGYTNVGKSTIMQLLSKSDVFAENKLFATVDSTVRKVVIHDIPFLLTDTVGFIRKLPHTLIECFKSTLDEVREADLLLHVVDISHPSFEEQMKIVNDTLLDIGAADKPTITVYNKIDLWQEQQHQQAAEDFDEEDGFMPEYADHLAQLKATYLNEGQETIFISATKKENIAALREALYNKVADKYFTIYPNYQKNTVF